MHGRDDPPAAAQVKDGSASVPVTLDGSERGDATKKGDTFFRHKRRFGPRALGRDLSVFVSVQMRLRDLNNLVETGSPNEAACVLAEVSVTAQVVAMRALPALSAARVLNAMSATTRAAVSSGIDPATVALADAMLTNPTPVRTATQRRFQMAVTLSTKRLWRRRRFQCSLRRIARAKISPRATTRLTRTRRSCTRGTSRTGGDGLRSTKKRVRVFMGATSSCDR